MERLTVLGSGGMGTEVRTCSFKGMARIKLANLDELLGSNLRALQLRGVAYVVADSARTAGEAKQGSA